MGIDPVTHEPLIKNTTNPTSDKGNGQLQVQVVPEGTPPTAPNLTSEDLSSSCSTSENSSITNTNDESQLVLDTMSDNDPLLSSLLENNAPPVDLTWNLSDDQMIFDNLTIPKLDENFAWLMDCQDFGIDDFGYECPNNLDDRGIKVVAQLWTRFGVMHAGSFVDLMKACMGLHGSAILIAACAWVVWNARNDAVWNAKSYDINAMQRMVESNVETWQQVYMHSPSSLPNPTTFVSTWSPPPQGMLKCNVDAALLPNAVGFGAVVRDHGGSTASFSLVALYKVYKQESPAIATGAARLPHRGILTFSPPQFTPPFHRSRPLIRPHLQAPTWEPPCCGSQFTLHRKTGILREMLSSANLRACHEHRREEVRKAIRSVRSRIGEPVNIAVLASSTEINVITSMIWGSTLGSDEAKIDQIGAEFREIMGKFVAMVGEPNISDFFPWLARLDLQRVQARMEGMVKVVDNIFDPIIKEGVRIVSEKSGSTTKDDEKKDFLQILLELKDRDDNAGKSLDFQAIKAMLLDIVIGGTDTTATMVEWVMTTLLDNPEIMKKVQKELEEVVGMTSIVEEVHLPKLKYLDAVVKETFRLYPALPLLIPKCPSQTTEVGGYTIPKDTRVFLNMYAIHRDPKLWDNPLQFSPERFFNQTFGLDYTGNDHRFLPFGSGRRICAGIPLAEKMLIYILGSLLHSFDWHLPDGEKMDLSDGFGLVIKKKTPLIAIPAPRLFNSELYQ
nr:angelicin synthase-like [Ipomoea batatas]